ncbi:hypothetical protein VF21_03499 [Pseudogymnoascus sp. 05NY08]|nr:hypothetical protein VF21_03499 [Pseudogymnoascus sp. 05NY08]
MSIGLWKTHGNFSIPSSPGYNKIDANILAIPAKDASEKGSYLLYYHYIANFTDVLHPGTFGWNKLDLDATGWPEMRALSNPAGSNPTGTGTGAAPTVH